MRRTLERIYEGGRGKPRLKNVRAGKKRDEVSEFGKVEGPAKNGYVKKTER